MRNIEKWPNILLNPSGETTASFSSMFGHFSTVGIKGLSEVHLVKEEKNLRKGNRKLNMMVVLFLHDMTICVK